MIIEFESSIPKFWDLGYESLEFVGLEPGGLETYRSRIRVLGLKFFRLGFETWSRRLEVRDFLSFDFQGFDLG
jgi:hypothetical protein